MLLVFKKPITMKKLQCNIKSFFITTKAQIQPSGHRVHELFEDLFEYIGMV